MTIVGEKTEVEYGDGCPLDAGILWTKKRVYAVLWGVKGPAHEADAVAAAVQRVLASAQEVQGWPEELPGNVRRQAVPGDGRCLYWALICNREHLIRPFWYTKFLGPRSPPPPLLMFSTALEVLQCSRTFKSCDRPPVPRGRSVAEYPLLHGLF